MNQSAAAPHGRNAGDGDGDARPQIFLLRVAGLDGPPVGGGCCAVSCEDVALDELDSWPGLLPLHIDPDAGTILVRVEDEADLGYAVEALNDRGLPTTVADQTTPHPEEAEQASPGPARGA